MNHKMTSEPSLQLLTQSQEEMVRMEDVLPGVSIEQLLKTTEPFEPIESKYDISQELLEQQHQISLLHQSPMTNDEFPGHLNFQLMPDQQDDTKSWVYSQKLKKVFIEMEKTLPIQVKCTPPQSGLFVRATMAFCQPTYRSEPVTQCHNHALSKQTMSHPGHVLRCKDLNADYATINGHNSVIVPLGIPQPGSDSVQMDFTFHCKNSCCPGINRRQTEVVFNLENKSCEVLGRRKLLVRICSCPKRDKEKEERTVRDYPAPKKRKLAAGKKFIPVYREQPQLEVSPEIYTFTTQIYGRENYETAKRLIYGLMAETMDRTGQQAIIKPLLDDLRRMP